MQDNVLAITDNVVVPLNEVLNVMRSVKQSVEEINPLVITQASSLSTFLSLSTTTLQMNNCDLFHRQGLNT